MRTSPIHVRKEIHETELYPRKETYKNNMPTLLHDTCLLHPHQLYTCAKRDQLICKKRSVKVTCLLFNTTHVYCMCTSPIHVRKETHDTGLYPRKETYKNNMPTLQHDTCLLHPHQLYTCAKRDL